MFALVIRFVFEELAERINELAGVSRSLMVKEFVAAAASSFVAMSGRVEIVGGLFTVNTLLNACVRPGALAVNCLFVPPASISRFV
jgi:hypothetical protein